MVQEVSEPCWVRKAPAIFCLSLGIRQLAFGQDHMMAFLVIRDALNREILTASSRQLLS